jgi:sRNA-binding carbon storage regulator CsrA
MMIGDNLLVTVAKVLLGAVELAVHDYPYARMERSVWLEEGESKEIAPEVWVTYCGCQNGVDGPRVKIEIKAESLPVHRKEVWDAIRPTRDYLS